MKQRKKELIIARQLERRQHQELIRQKRENERMRKAEEIRMRDEEAAQKKMLEKTRKEVIFQAYIEKKKQAQDECSAAYFGGPPNSNLINAKRFHSTLRLKQQSKLNNQAVIDQFDTGSPVGERSMLQNEQSPSMKSKYLLMLYIIHLSKRKL